MLTRAMGKTSVDATPPSRTPARRSAANGSVNTTASRPIMTKNATPGIGTNWRLTMTRVTQRVSHTSRTPGVGRIARDACRSPINPSHAAGGIVTRSATPRSEAPTSNEMSEAACGMSGTSMVNHGVDATNGRTIRRFVR
jgi:hypothetical protein